MAMLHIKFFEGEGGRGEVTVKNICGPLIRFLKVPNFVNPMLDLLSHQPEDLCLLDHLEVNELLQGDEIVEGDRAAQS